MNAIAQEATKFQRILQALKIQLTGITESPYYKQLTDSGFYIVDVTLTDALLAVKETMQVNEQIIEVTNTYPEDDLKMAIAKYLQSQTDENAIADIEQYL